MCAVRQAKKDALGLFFDYTKVMGLPKGLPHKVLWNGEDIFMTLTHKFAYVGCAHCLRGR